MSSPTLPPQTTASPEPDSGPLPGGSDCLQHRFTLKRFLTCVIGTTLCLFFIPYGAWCLFIFPLADDFAWVNWDLWSFKGLVSMSAGFYLNTGGMYVSIVFRWLHAHLTAAGLYQLSPLIAFAIHILGGTIAFRLLSRRTLRWRGSILVAGLWLALYLSTMYSTADSIYWATGMLVYEPGNILALIFGVMCLTDRWPKNIRGYLCPPVVVMLLCGCHFPYIFWALAMSAERVVRSVHRRYWLGVLSLAMVCSSVSILAPGNFARQAKTTGDQMSLNFVIHQIGRSVFSFAGFLGREISDGRLWVAVAMATLFFMRSAESAQRERWTWPMRLVPIVFWWGALYCVFLLSALGGFDPPFPRTLNGLHYLFLCGSILFVAPELGRILRSQQIKLPLREDSTQAVIPYLAIGLCMLLLISPNYVRCVRELGGSARDYRQHWTDMSMIAEHARRNGETTIELPISPKVKPRTVYCQSWLKADVSEWPNPNYARFFGVDEVIGVENEDTPNTVRHGF